MLLCMVKEDGRLVGRKLAIAEPGLEAFVAQRTEDSFRMRVLLGMAQDDVHA